MSWEAQMHASKGKQLWRQEKMAAMGLDQADIVDAASSQEGIYEGKEKGGADPLQPKKPKQTRESPPEGCACVACWNLERGKKQAVAHSTGCPRARVKKAKLEEAM